ncbi:DUF4157 domain-containing protein [Rhizobium sp. CNPSo 3968]|uniref:eCIS core domain-containing protein n=1 Tax=Rhizobium sp. CNPSo 3968 TaxID=3021408 RepID=UPI00254F3CBD|nr:DUF4157 domain-containing protein [Rhizobium sp. CNPSo 3968]MDK4723386.1 DUF4157 domain-containing protein [Rhizobium sp. CNPSo 3968]
MLLHFIGKIGAVSSLAIVVSTSAYACGGPLDVACNVGKAIEKGAQDTGKTVEKGAQDTQRSLSDALNRIDPRITQIGRDLDRIRLNFQASVFGGPALEQWFINSRNTAIQNAQPIYPEMRAAMQGWYDDSVLNNVWFKVGDGGALNLANASIQLRDVQAVTLIDVIVFRDQQGAATPSLWAHELQHVKQFQDWGVHSFAVQYVRSWNSVEDPAYKIEAEYANNPGPRSGPNIILPGPPPGAATAWASICRVGPGPNDFCQLSQPMPQRSNCSCQGANRIWYGMTQ